MAKAFLLETIFLLFYRILFRKLKGFRKNVSNSHAASHSKYHKYPSLVHRSSSSDLSNHVTLIFNVEEALLKSSSSFPYFMLVAFEAGGLIRSLVLLLLYPFICLVSEEMGFKIMVMVCFVGIKKDSFRLGSAVLPKFFLEDVGLEMFEVVQRGSRKVAVSNFPAVMVESFLRDYLRVDAVVGERELRVFRGYFVGLMEERKIEYSTTMEEIIAEKKMGSDIIGITSTSSFNKFPDDHQLFSHCKEVYLVSNAEKRGWQNLPRDKYPKPLIFHDGRLAVRPTPLETLVILMWVPFGFILAVLRIAVGVSLPYGMSSPILSFSGLRLTVTNKKSETRFEESATRPEAKGVLYVCNHRTLLDPLYLSFSLKTNLIALTYSLSRMSEILSPIKTVRLSRNRDKDANTMERLLNLGDLVICPEGTTCREPYLLRFSPLFSEISDEIVPVAVDTQVSMFHGTTAGGLKCLDPIFFLINPSPIYTVQLLDKVSGLAGCSHDDDDGNKSRFDVANYVQTELGKALGFERTQLSRRDKYLILAGNEGITCTK